MEHKVALVELDGVLADASSRFQHAEQVKQQVLGRGMAIVSAVDAYLRAAFAATIENVGQDILIEGAKEALETLQQQGYRVILLTSRPEDMREVTTAWLATHAIPTEHPTFFSRLVMKPTAFKYVKTALWKVGMTQTLAALLAAHDLLFIDPLIANQQEVQKHGLADLFHLRGCFSLAEAIAPPLEGETDETRDDEQPFCQAIVLKRKTIELRIWGTRYRGMNALHASNAWYGERDDGAQFQFVSFSFNPCILLAIPSFCFCCPQTPFFATKPVGLDESNTASSPASFYGNSTFSRS